MSLLKVISLPNNFESFTFFFSLPEREMDQIALHHLSIMEMGRWGIWGPGAPKHGKLGSRGHCEEYIRLLPRLMFIDNWKKHEMQGNMAIGTPDPRAGFSMRLMKLKLQDPTTESALAYFYNHNFVSFKEYTCFLLLSDKLP